jgi:hypothetical protein
VVHSRVVGLAGRILYYKKTAGALSEVMTGGIRAPGMRKDR